MVKRLWCYLRGHRLLRKKIKNDSLSYWTSCARCRQLMVRGYDGWQKASRAERASYKRAVARQKIQQRSSSISDNDAAG